MTMTSRTESRGGATLLLFMMGSFEAVDVVCRGQCVVTPAVSPGFRGAPGRMSPIVESPGNVLWDSWLLGDCGSDERSVVLRVTFDVDLRKCTVKSGGQPPVA